MGLPKLFTEVYDPKMDSFESKLDELEKHIPAFKTS